MKMILSEAAYSFKKSMFFNLILIAQLTLLFWLLTLIASYYADLPISVNTALTDHGDWSYYSLIRGQYEADVSEFFNETNGADAEYPQKARAVLNDLQNDPDYTYMAMHSVFMPVHYEFIMDKIGKDKILNFCRNSPSGYIDESEEYDEEMLQPIHAELISSAFELSVCNVDKNYINHFAFKVQEGRLFSEEDYIFKAGQKEIPVVLGSEYKDYFEVGETFEVMLHAELFQARVIGIMAGGTAIISDRHLQDDGGNFPTLDYTILVPFFGIKRVPANEDQQYFDKVNYEYGLNGFVVTDKNMPRVQLNEITKRINESFRKNGLYPISLQGSSYGIAVFNQESEQTVLILTSLVLIMALFSIFSICLCLITKINRNLRRYSIQIMNGNTISAIVRSFLLEILLLVLMSISIASSLLMRQISRNIGFLLFMGIVAIMIAMIVSFVVTRKLRGINIEELIRRSE